MHSVSPALRRSSSAIRSSMRVAQVLGRDITVRQADERIRPDASEVDRLCSDNAKARQLLGWEPEVGLDEGLERTIDWVREHPELYSPSLYRI